MLRLGRGAVRGLMVQASSSPAEAPRTASVTQALGDVRARIEKAFGAAQAKGTRAGPPPRLVAVGKTKPAEMIEEAYRAGHRCFGENYVQEIVDKAGNLPSDIEWHFIGHLQSNKAKALLEGVPNLAMLETVDSAKLANRLNRLCGDIDGRGEDRPLRVLVQVNTSGEESKHGVEPEDAVDLAAHIRKECPNLSFAGFMTIGMKDYTSKPENFETLSACRARACEAFGISEEACELSMGMSGDFEQAVTMGSTNIRVGSTIFGARVYPNT